MKLLVEFGRGVVQDPAIADVILETGIPVNIERAMIEGEEGWVLLAVDDAQAELFSQALAPRRVRTRLRASSASPPDNKVA